MMKALIKGFWRVVSSPGLVLWLWFMNLVMALPLAWVMSASIQTSLGDSMVDDKLREGFDMGWFGEFEAHAKGLETTFTPTLSGAGAFYANLEAWLSGEIFGQIPLLAGVGILYGLVWALFLGGMLDRYAGSEGMFNLNRFFSLGGRFFFRFIRLAVFSGVLYYLIYRFAGWLFGWVEASTIDVTWERTVIFYTLSAAVLVAFLLTLVNMIFDYAKIAAFKEDRRSMILAALQGGKLVFSSPLKTMGLYYTLVAIGAVLLGFYASIAPGAGPSTASGVWVAFLIGQAFLIVRLMMRLWFYGGQMALYESMTSAPAVLETPAPPEKSEPLSGSSE
jgi:hypothetical protein